VQDDRFEHRVLHDLKTQKTWGAENLSEKLVQVMLASTETSGEYTARHRGEERHYVWHLEQTG
jgi:hypothetical protein